GAGDRGERGRAPCLALGHLGGALLGAPLAARALLVAAQQPHALEAGRRLFVGLPQQPTVAGADGLDPLAPLQRPLDALLVRRDQVAERADREGGREDG